jgi:hypothetical protein
MGAADFPLRRGPLLRLPRSRLCELLGVEIPDSGDGVGLLDRFVGPISFDPREAQGEPARILGTRLDLVEGDLHDHLWAHMDHTALAADLEIQETLGLPRRNRLLPPRIVQGNC